MLQHLTFFSNQQAWKRRKMLLDKNPKKRRKTKKLRMGILIIFPQV